MKHGKHSKMIINEDNDLDIVSSTKKRKKNDEDIILSKTPKGRKVYDLITKLLFALEMLLVIALVIHATVIELFPMVYIFILVALLGVLAGIHIWLLSGKKKRFKTKRTISLVLSIIVFMVSAFGMSYMGLIDNAIGDLALGEEENENQVENIAKNPFVVYLSGLDTRNSGEIAEKGLSDVNMVIAVNPEQKRVLMISTPRDYYVALDGDPNKMDKLTHAGSYGIECSMKTLENLYDIKFNYYAKINFKSVHDIVDAVGGVTVNSDFDFYSRYSFTKKKYHFVKGENQLTGDAALAFARERKSFANGDRQRGIHQQKVIKAVVEKAISPSMLIPANIESMLKAISDNTKTNFSVDEIKDLVKYQMKSMKKGWDFQTMSVDGTGGYAYTYSYSRQQLYVMRPNEETVNEAKEALQAVINGEPLPSETESEVSSTAGAQ